MQQNVVHVINRMTRMKKLSFELLRLIMCFEIVLCHLGRSNHPVWQNFFYRLSVYAVDVFMLMSFYLAGKHFCPLDKKMGYLGNRIKQLYSPVVGWTVIYTMAYLLAKLVFGLPFGSFPKCVIQQLVVCSPMNPPMWFHFSLIILTIVLYCIFRRIQYHRCIIGGGILLLALILQYTGINYMLFKDFSYEYRYSFGRIVEMIPYATLGIMISDGNVKWKWDSIDKKKRELISLIILIGIIVLIMTDNVVEIEGFGYSGVRGWGIAAGIVFLAIIGSDVYEDSPFGRKIRSVSSVTMGVYCMHWLMVMVLERSSSLIPLDQSDGMFVSLGVTVFCLLVSIPIAKLPVLKKLVT